ncbi:collagen alpha-1(I) chain-like [Melospiza melodia melodia]|uniref:collagen alpha-1(I) chain-like n=1 Tax=Melospiza melodia melodia TaxID=1914991 RepID=UPI002FD6BF97
MGCSGSQQSLRCGKMGNAERSERRKAISDARRCCFLRPGSEASSEPGARGAAPASGGGRGERSLGIGSWQEKKRSEGPRRGGRRVGGGEPEGEGAERRSGQSRRLRKPGPQERGAGEVSLALPAEEAQGRASRRMRGTEGEEAPETAAQHLAAARPPGTPSSRARGGRASAALPAPPPLPDVHPAPPGPHPPPSSRRDVPSTCFQPGPSSPALPGPRHAQGTRGPVTFGIPILRWPSRLPGAGGGRSVVAAHLPGAGDTRGGPERERGSDRDQDRHQHRERSRAPAAAPASAQPPRCPGVPRAPRAPALPHFRCPAVAAPPAAPPLPRRKGRGAWRGGVADREAAAQSPPAAGGEWAGTAPARAARPRPPAPPPPAAGSRPARPRERRERARAPPPSPPPPGSPPPSSALRPPFPFPSPPGRRGTE